METIVGIKLINWVYYTIKLVAIMAIATKIVQLKFLSTMNKRGFTCS